MLGGEDELRDPASDLQRRSGVRQSRLGQTRAAVFIVRGPWQVDRVVKPDGGLDLVGALRGARLRSNWARQSRMCSAVW